MDFPGGPPPVVARHGSAVAISVGHQPMSLRGTKCRGNLGGAVAEGIGVCVPLHLPSTEIASSPRLLAKTVGAIPRLFHLARKDRMGSLFKLGDV